MQLQSSKGQVAITDMFIALFIFVILIVFIASIWNQYNLKLDDTIVYEDMITKTFQISDVLIKSPGYPKIWNSTNVEVIGLAENDRMLSNEKVGNLTNMTIDKIKENFHLGPYKFNFTLKTVNGNEIASKGEPLDGLIVNIKRYVIYEDEEAVMELALGR